MTTVGILLITHVGVGQSFKETAQTMLGPAMPERVAALSVPWSSDTAAIAAKARALRDTLDDGGGVLVLSDICGATPANIGRQLVDGATTRMVCGLNLPMLIRALNYCHLELGALVDKALSGGSEGVREESHA